VGQPAEEVPQVPAQDRVEPDRGLVEDEQLGLADERCGQRDARALTSREVAHGLVGVRREVHGVDRTLDGTGRRTEHRGEVAEVVAHRQVGIDARRLGDVANPVAQPRRPGRFPEDGDRPRLDPLDSDDGPHEGGLAAPAGAEEPNDLTGGDDHAEVVQDPARTAHHPQVLDDDRVALRAFHHLMNLNPNPLPPQPPVPATDCPFGELRAQRATLRTGNQSGLGRRCCCREGPRMATSSSTVAFATAGTRTT